MKCYATIIIAVFATLALADDGNIKVRSTDLVCLDHYEKFKQSGVPDEQIRADIEIIEEAVATSLKQCFIEDKQEPTTYEEFLNNIISICREYNQE